jgi:hypothetical protein
VSGQPAVQTQLYDSAGHPDGSQEARAALVGSPRGTAQRACSTCGSTGRCEGRLPITDGGWVCSAAQTMGLFEDNGKHLWVRLRSGPEVGR